MSKVNKILAKICRRWVKFRLQPIRVYCLHHVCQTFDAESMHSGDWMQMDDFKRKVLTMRQSGVEFISLTHAYTHICKDLFRLKKYAVLTFDDGYASLKEILPWLDEQHIPVTLFINGKYLDGKSYRKNPKEHYLTYDELFALASTHTHTSGARQMVEVGSHGWEHTDASKISTDEFKKNVQQNVDLLHSHPRYIPYHAYTWGKHNGMTDIILQSKNIIPVYMDGVKNYNDQHIIHRELLKL